MRSDICNLPVAQCSSVRRRMQPDGCLSTTPSADGEKELDDDLHRHRLAVKRAGPESPLPRGFERFRVETEIRVERAHDACVRDRAVDADHGPDPDAALQPGA